MTIFSDMVDDTIKVFMDEFLVFGDSFKDCLEHLNMFYGDVKIGTWF